MARGSLGIWDLLAFLALIAFVVALLRGVFLATGRKLIHPSGRQHAHDDWGHGHIGKNSHNSGDSLGGSDGGGND